MNIRHPFFLLLLSLPALSLMNVPSPAFDRQAEPEAAGAAAIKRSATMRHHMVVTANPHASHAGRQILRQGGSAVDATIAVQMVLTLVEPQSSGLGGGAFMLHWDHEARRLTSFDGRETAPITAKPMRFMRDGTPLKFRDAVPGGLSVGTPGVLKMLALAHRRYGRLPWQQLFQPAIQLSRQGFPISPRLHNLLRKAGPTSFNKAARAYFFDSTGHPRPVGSRLANPQLAGVLTQIAAHGPTAFYQGELARDITAAVQQSRRNPGDLALGDLAGYKAVERPPVCITYRAHHICGMGPPSSGMLTIAQILKLLEPFDLGRQPLNKNALHLIAEASRLAYADRGRYMADSDFVKLPDGLLDERYLAVRRRLITPDKTMGKASPGLPPRRQGRFGVDATIENRGTSHISIVDRFGNAVSMTSSIEGAFGARLMVGGFLLNNELTDFSFRPTDQAGRPVANRVEPGKRPRSSMAPVMVFDAAGRLNMVTGSPGGSRIILYVLKTLIGHIDWQLNGHALVQLPNFGARNGPLELEHGHGVETIAKQLARYGHKTRITPMTSGVHLVLRRGSWLTGAADPRREGLALGD